MCTFGGSKFQIMDNTNLENRLIDFSVSVITTSDKIKNNYAGIHLSKQLIRSGTSVSLNYGETRGAESKRDFIHKMGIVVKELRESHNCLRIIKKAELHKEPTTLELLIDENNQLISIFVASIKTAKRLKSHIQNQLSNITYQSSKFV